MHLVSASLLLTLAVMVQSCWNDGSSTMTGMEGTAMLESPCPTASSDTDCPARPWPGATLGVYIGTDLVMTVETDEQGRFTAELEPGTYSVQPYVAEREDGLPQAPMYTGSHTVQVEENEMVGVSLLFSSGVQ